MESTNKVFCSDIIRTGHCHKNNLYDLLKIKPVKPLELNNVKRSTCEFKPNTNKIYIPKRRLRAKVKTVRDIRTTFENDTYAYLKGDLETQQNYVLKKIRDGYSNNEKTQNIAKKILKSDTSISRPTWQMLLNLNPNHKIEPQQFVIWNGKSIQVTGSKGGNNKLICNYDLANTKIPLQVKNKNINIKKINKRKGLLRNSLAIKFRPGPLERKKYLDDSHQKYHGDIELVHLPKVGLVVQPTYGTAMEPTITNFLNNLCKEDGVISEKWAEFAVSVLGTVDKSNASLLNRDCVTFDIKYKCNQHRILMRKDFENVNVIPNFSKTSTASKSISNTQVNVLPEIRDMMNKILDAVDISISQDNMLLSEEDLTYVSVEKSNPPGIGTLSKDKIKKKYCELDRLDVTVIRIPENSEKDCTQSCGKAYCSLGCICTSIANTKYIRQHCGLEKCMFNCKCDFYKYNNIMSLNMNEPDSTQLMTGLINIKNEIDMKLAKEEQKFHQTVIVSGKKNILLKNENRNWKSSKKYGTFYKNVCVKNDNHVQRVLSITTLRLDCDNVEPWCMVHNLYKCFCKGKFTSSSFSTIQQDLQKEANDKDTGYNVKCPSVKLQKCSSDIPLKTYLRKDAPVNTSDISGLEKRKTLTVSDILNKRHRNLCDISESVLDKNNENESDNSNSKDIVYSECSRVNGYVGRKYNNEHYKLINCKIKEMEKNDKVLKKKIKSAAGIDEDISMLLEKKQEKEHVLTNETLQKNRIFDSQLILQEENTQTNMEKYKINISIDEDSRTRLEKIQEKQQVLINETIQKNPRIDSQKKIQEGNVQTNVEQDKTQVSETSHNFIKFLYDINGVKCRDDKSNKTALSTEMSAVEWLESNYKLCKKGIDEGLVKTSLEPPKPGKIALHSWDFILSRYRERKNLFLISKQKPYRIFMGIHTRSQFFESCININEIRFADLHKYPQTVKNLLTNATGSKDNFYILRGLSHCWELAGSVAKIVKKDHQGDEINSGTSDTNSSLHDILDDAPNEGQSIQDSEQTNDQNLCLEEEENVSECPNETESSKWFIMTVENDFTEIRFYKRGFFVKYESIVKAISVARMSGKTVRLSSQKCVDKCNGPQFGIYAIPNESEYCVFIGPYEMDDSLGIETIKSITDVRKTAKTRGFFMNTNKVDNLKVIDNPLSFIPLSDLKINEAVPLEQHFCKENKNLNEKESQEILHLKKIDDKQQKTLLKLDRKKIIKPIKIRKMGNGFFHLAKGSLLKKVALQSSHKVLLTPTLAIDTDMNVNTNSSSNTLPDNSTSNIENSLISQPQDININDGPQIKISAVYSQRDEQNDIYKNERAMMILKPEEINRRVFNSQLNFKASTSKEILSDDLEENLSPRKIENQLVQGPDIETSTILTPCGNGDNVFVISDDECHSNDEEERTDRWKQILIICTDIINLGWIWGRQFCKSRLLSYKVPGGEYSDFYTKKYAFKKLNSDLSQIVNASQPFDFKWTVIDSLEDLETEVNPLDFKRLQKTLKLRGQCSETDNVKTNSKNTATK